MTIIRINFAVPFVFLICLSLSSSSLAQKTSLTNKSIIKFNATGAIDPFSFPTIQFSYERKLTKRVSLAGEFGYQLYQLPESKLDRSDPYLSSQFTTNSDTSFVSPTGFKANLEGRYYFIRPRHKRLLQLSLYAATNFFYRKNREDISILYLKDSISASVDCYWLRRRNWGGLEVAGMQVSYKKFIFELYAGVGFTDRFVVNYNREYNQETDGLETNRHGFGAERKFLQEDNEGTVIFSGGIRIGISFH